MDSTLQTNNRMVNILAMNERLQKNWSWLLGIGILLVILGAISMTVAAFTTILSMILLGAFLLVNGATLIFQAFKVWETKDSKFYLQILVGIIYLIGGFGFMFYPVSGAVSLTLFVAIFYIILGAYRSLLALTQRFHGWGWVLFSSLITLLLGILVLSQWPLISLWVIGVFVGIDILFVGFALIMMALSARSKMMAV